MTLVFWALNTIFISASLQRLPNRWFGKSDRRHQLFVSCRPSWTDKAQWPSLLTWGFEKPFGLQFYRICNPLVRLTRLESNYCFRYYYLELYYFGWLLPKRSSLLAGRGLFFINTLFFVSKYLWYWILSCRSQCCTNN